MNSSATTMPGVFLLQPKVFEDPRGYFYEGYSPALFRELGVHGPFVQENVSGSVKGVLRGLHYQIEPLAQGKLVRVSRGEVFDVVVDLRRGSPTYGRWLSQTLSAESRQRLWVPPGLAHGFCVLSDFAEFIYSVTKPYSPSHERTILWDDPDIGIAWPRTEGGFILSDKDRHGARLGQAEHDFSFEASPGHDGREDG